MTRKQQMQKQIKTKNVERHAIGLSKLKFAKSKTPFHLNDAITLSSGFIYKVGA
jgi:hypothetical protein